MLLRAGISDWYMPLDSRRKLLDWRPACRLLRWSLLLPMRCCHGFCCLFPLFQKAKGPEGTRWLKKTLARSAFLACRTAPNRRRHRPPLNPSKPRRTLTKEHSPKRFKVPLKAPPPLLHLRRVPPPFSQRRARLAGGTAGAAPSRSWIPRLRVGPSARACCLRSRVEVTPY